jgi:DNA-binding MarR family transcriptional regulator
VTAVKQVSPEQAIALDELRMAMVELFGAERRLRGREQQRSHALSNSQLRALSALAQDHEVTAGELAKSADLNPASVTAMLDQLEANGIIERRRGAPDRRVCMVSLTEKGRAILDERRAHWEALWEEYFGDLSEAELAVGSRVMRQMIQMLDGI